MTDYVLPDDLPPFQMSFWLQPHTARSESPFTRQQKVYALSAPRWICTLSFRGGYDGTDGIKAFGPRLDALLAELEGGANRLLVHNVSRETMRGPGWDDDATNEEAAAGATSMVLTGFANNATNVVLPGDYIGGDGRPHIITRAADADGSGEATVYFKPPLAAYVGPGAAIFGNPKGAFRLTSDDAGANPVQVGDVVVYSLELAEDLNRRPLPRLAAIGHSFVERNHFAPGDGTYIQTRAVGEIVTAQALNPRFEFIIWNDVTAPNYWRGANLGESGDTSAMALVRLPDLIALDADIWVIQLGINDIRGGIPVATAMANIQTIAEAGLELGKQIVIANVIPVAEDAEGPGTWPLGDPKRAAIATLNGLIAAYCTATRRVTLWAAAGSYGLTADGSGTPYPGFTEDGIHPSRLGAFSAGSASLNTALDLIIDDSWSAIPTGTNLFSNSALAGTGGTAGGGVTGTVADDWTFANATGTGGSHATAVGSQSGGHQRFVITATAAGSTSEIFQLSRDSGGITVEPGTWIQIWADITLSSWLGWRQIIMRGDPLLAAMDYASFVATEVMVNGFGNRMRPISPPFLVPDGTTSISPYLVVVVDGTANSAGTIDITELGCVVVEDPRPRYGF